MKKLLTLLLSATLVFTLSACGSKESGNEKELIDAIDKLEEVLNETETETEDAVDEKTEESKKEEKSEEVKEETKTELVNGMRKEFKEAMDAYEEFYNEYCDLLEAYYDNPSDLTLLTKYTEFMSKAVEVDEKFNKWENEELNDAELKYYLEVNNRVLNKLSEVTQ